MRKIKYNQTQFLECISNAKESNFLKRHENVLELLIKISNGTLILDNKSIMELDMDLIEELETYIDAAFKDNGDGEPNPIKEIIRGSELKVSIDIMKVKDCCVRDKDFF